MELFNYQKTGFRFYTKNFLSKLLIHEKKVTIHLVDKKGEIKRSFEKEYKTYQLALIRLINTCTFHCLKNIAANEQAKLKNRAKAFPQTGFLDCPDNVIEFIFNLTQRDKDPYSKDSQVQKARMKSIAPFGHVCKKFHDVTQMMGVKAQSRAAKSSP